jgi:tripartite-type tricarboxylate transporter receptor subunit TctC
VRMPYKGGSQALTALMSNETQLTFLPAPSVLPFTNAGKLKILGTSSKARTGYLPDAPSFNESGIKDFDLGAWQGVVAPAKTPVMVIDTLSSRR